jgi:hypothetical protein
MAAPQAEAQGARVPIPAAIREHATEEVKSDYGLVAPGGVFRLSRSVDGVGPVAGALYARHVPAASARRAGWLLHHQSRILISYSQSSGSGLQRWARHGIHGRRRSPPLIRMGLSKGLRPVRDLRCLLDEHAASASPRRSSKVSLSSTPSIASRSAVLPAKCMPPTASRRPEAMPATSPRRLSTAAWAGRYGNGAILR